MPQFYQVPYTPQLTDKPLQPVQLVVQPTTIKYKTPPTNPTHTVYMINISILSQTLYVIREGVHRVGVAYI